MTDLLNGPLGMVVLGVALVIMVTMIRTYVEAGRGVRILKMMVIAFLTVMVLGNLHRW